MKISVLIAPSDEYKRSEKSAKMSLAFSARFQRLYCAAARACHLNRVRRGVVARNSPLLYAETSTVQVSMRQARSLVTRE